MVFTYNFTCLIDYAFFEDLAAKGSAKKSFSGALTDTKTGKVKAFKSSMATIDATTMHDSEIPEDLRKMSFNADLHVRTSAFAMSIKTTSHGGDFVQPNSSSGLVTTQTGGNVSLVGTPVSVTLSLTDDPENKKNLDGVLNSTMVTDPKTSTKYMKHEVQFSTPAAFVGQTIPSNMKTVNFLDTKYKDKNMLFRIAQKNQSGNYIDGTSIYNGTITPSGNLPKNVELYKDGSLNISSNTKDKMIEWLYQEGYNGPRYNYSLNATTVDWNDFPLYTDFTFNTCFASKTTWVTNTANYFETKYVFMINPII